MQRSRSQFDYEAILEACGIQDVHLRTALDEKNKLDAKFRDDLDTFKRLSKERDDNNAKLNYIKLDQKKQLHKLKQIIKKTSTLNGEQKQIQEDIANLQQEFQKQLNGFIETMNKMDEQLNILYSQFEGETLARLISEVDNELIYYHNMEEQLQGNYNELKNSQLELDQYERLLILKTAMDNVPETGDIDDIKRKIADKKKNIQFLEAEFNKKMELLQKYV